jgi:anti-anti-sigma factor
MAESDFQVLRVGGVSMVIAPEEIDICNSDQFRAALAEAATLGNDRVLVDMSQTQFCDSTGLHALVRAHQRAQAAGGDVLLVMSGGPVRRLLAVTGVERVIRGFHTLAEALQHVPAVPSPRPAVEFAD